MVDGTDSESTSDEGASKDLGARGRSTATDELARAYTGVWGVVKTQLVGRWGSSGVVVGYDVDKLSTSIVFLVWQGTVLSSWVLWAEQALVLLTYVVFAYVSATFFDFGENPEHKASEVRGLQGSVAALAAFLLGFYTSLTVSRWWRLRCDGIGNIWSSSSQLCMYISECVTRDEQVLCSIRRYARASLIIRFLQRRYPGKLTENLWRLVDKNVLTEEELQKLKGYNSNLSESIWTWVTRIVMNLYRKGDIKSDLMLNFILERVAKGRSGSALIGAQMGTPIPLPYVHLLGLLVKVQNYIMALCAGYLVAADPTEWPIISIKVSLVPFFYNAILLINADLADPFDGGVNDFPLGQYEGSIQSDGQSYVDAGDHTPEWMQFP